MTARLFQKNMATAAVLYKSIRISKICETYAQETALGQQSDNYNT